VRLDTYTFEEHEMHDAIERLLGDEVLRARLRAQGQRIAAANGTTVAADLIEELGRKRRR
jgi:UDP:flavonoid glycosyltransferase YjiC (YdhE family)